LILTQHATGAKWKFPIDLNATLPHLDDTIVIQGKAKSITSVSFSIKNTFEFALPFQAYFLNRKTAHEMQISPCQGTLVPEKDKTENDNQFVVSYQPTINGKSSNSVLVIETSEFCLFYEIRGVTPLKSRK
jgi:hypothetical protein